MPITISEKLQHGFYNYQESFFLNLTAQNFARIYWQEEEHAYKYYNVSLEEYRFHLWALALVNAMISSDMEFVKYFLQFDLDNKKLYMTLNDYKEWVGYYFAWEGKKRGWKDWQGGAKKGSFMGHAVLSGNVEIVKMLAAALARSHLRLSDEKNLINFLVLLERDLAYTPDIIEQLFTTVVLYGANPDMVDTAGRTPYYYIYHISGVKVEKSLAPRCEKLLNCWREQESLELLFASDEKNSPPEVKSLKP